MKTKPSIVLKILICFTVCLKLNLSNSIKSSDGFCSSKCPIAVEMKAILCNMHQKIWEWSV